MGMLVQHGYGKSNKAETALRSGFIDGVILAAKDEPLERMVRYCGDLRREFNHAMLLLDPQFHLATLPSAAERYLPQYPYFTSNLTRARFVRRQDIHKYCRSALEYQLGLPVDRLVSPTVYVENLNDPWSQIALTLGQESMSIHSGLRAAAPLVVSLAVDESALADREAVRELLDIVSLWEVQGFYVVVKRNDSAYPALFRDAVLANLMYIAYVLGRVNEFEVFAGYADFSGLLLAAVGGTWLGTGWSQNLRQWRPLRSTGGRAARPRYSSARLMNSILLNPELDTIQQVGLLPEVLSGTAFDRVFAVGRPSAQAWSAETSALHHWAVIHELERAIVAEPVTTRLAKLQELIAGANATYGQLADAGVPFESFTGARNLVVWNSAIQMFRELAEL